MNKDDYYSDSEVAEILRIKKSTLVKNRCLGKNHPPYVKFGRNALYPKKEVANWLKELPLNREITCASS